MNDNNIKNIISECNGVTIVGASKYVTSKEILALKELGITNFGENRVDAFLTKYQELENENITWHFIGHLQRNKASKVANKIEYLHSLDSLELASILDKILVKPLKCFVEVKLAASEAKHGIDKNDLSNFLNELKQYSKIEVIGLMTMSDKEMKDEEKLSVFIELKNLAQQNNLSFTSMGMSDDYKLALKAKTSHVRLGRILFKD